MKKAIALSALLSASLVSFVFAQSPASSCLNLSRNLGIGSKDSLTGGEVTKVQAFLHNTHLSVSPTGYYGKMTHAAVKSFQASQGIDQVGVVGPKTRAKINELSCAGVTPAPQVTQGVNEYKNTTTTQGGIVVSVPSAGQLLKNESSIPVITTITWEQIATPKDVIVHLDLYNVNGTLTKVITATGTPNNGSYVWRYDPTLENGTYKIVVRGGTSSGESGIFTVGGTTTTVVTNPPVTPPPQGTSTNPSILSRDYIGTTNIPCPWGETRIGPCKYQGKLMSEAYPPPRASDASSFQEMNSGSIPYYGQTNHQPLYLGGGKKVAIKFKGDATLLTFPVVFGAGTVQALQVPMEMFIAISRTKGDFNVAPGCLVTPASLVNGAAGGAPHAAAKIEVAWKGGPYDQEAWVKNGNYCILEPGGYYYLNVTGAASGACSEYWDPNRAYLGWQNDCPTVITNVNGWMQHLNPN